MSKFEWTDAERESVREAPVPGEFAPAVVDEILAALAPFVAAREERARAEATRETA